MMEKDSGPTRGELAWWMAIGLVILGCLGLFARYASRTAPVIQPVVSESPS